METKATHAVGFDIEHCGCDTASNQPTEYGLALMDLRNGHILCQKRIGYIILDPRKIWNPATYQWYQEEKTGKMRKALELIDQKEVTSDQRDTYIGGSDESICGHGGRISANRQRQHAARPTRICPCDMVNRYGVARLFPCQSCSRRVRTQIFGLYLDTAAWISGHCQY